MLVVLRGRVLVDDAAGTRWFDEYIGSCHTHTHTTHTYTHTHIHTYIHTRTAVPPSGAPPYAIRADGPACGWAGPDLLHRFRLWEVAAAVILASGYADVRARSQMATTVKSRCGHCLKLMDAQPHGYSVCRPCQRTVSQCALWCAPKGGRHRPPPSLTSPLCVNGAAASRRAGCWCGARGAGTAATWTTCARGLPSRCTAPLRVGISAPPARSSPRRRHRRRRPLPPHRPQSPSAGRAGPCKCLVRSMYVCNQRTTSTWCTRRAGNHLLLAPPPPPSLPHGLTPAPAPQRTARRRQPPERCGRLWQRSAHTHRRRRPCCPGRAGKRCCCQTQAPRPCASL
jgi:hypothetical protein